jgi:hypothetical protein
MHSRAAFTQTQQWENGQSVESFLDSYFGFLGWHIERTTPKQERVLHLGDRIFTRYGQSYFVEYKSGIQTHYSGNLFIETISVDTNGTPGWAYTCQADYLMYACLLDHEILVFIPAVLRSQIPEMKLKFRETQTRHGQNDGYNTHGLLVPLEYAKRNLASKVINL